TMTDAIHAPVMAPPIRTDEQILPRIRWVPIGKSNCYLNEEKSQPSPIFKIAVDILKQTNFFRAFTASSTIPAIFIQQFWDTICFDSKAGSYKCQLDEQWFNLTQDTLRDALQITPVDNITSTMLKGCGKNLLNLSTPSQKTKEVGITYSGEEESNSYPYPKYQEPVLGHLKFSAKGSKREVFGMTIPNELINNVIRGADYYDAYLEKVAKHQRYIAGEELTASKKPKPAPAKPQEKKRKPVSESSEAPPLAKRAKAGKVGKKRTVKSSKQLVDEFIDEGVLAAKPRLQDRGEIWKTVLQESLTDAYPTQRGPLPPVVRETDTGKFQPLPEVSGKGKEKVGHEDSTSLYVELGLSGSDTESDEEMPSVVRSGAQDEGQAGPDPGKLDEGADQIPVIQPQPEHMDEGFTAAAYPEVQENLKLKADEQVIPEEPVSSTGTLSSLQHLAKDFSFGDQFLNDKPSEADNEKSTVDTEVNQWCLSLFRSTLIPPMTSPR
ncbi:hypothetical protein Tco_0920957, partial [Tanacetum coccineum]